MKAIVQQCPGSHCDYLVEFIPENQSDQRILKHMRDHGCHSGFTVKDEVIEGLSVLVKLPEQLWA